MQINRGKLRTKFLISLTFVTAALTWTTLYVVRYRVQLRVRETISQELNNSVQTFLRLQAQREQSLERTSALLASLPPLKAVMTSQHAATIQDASRGFWSLAGSELFVMTDRSGNLVAVHSSAPSVWLPDFQSSVARSLQAQRSRDWWFSSGHLYEVYLEPIYLGPAGENPPLGMLALGQEINHDVALELAHVANSQVAFYYGDTIIAATISAREEDALEKLGSRAISAGTEEPSEIQLVGQAFLATSVDLAQSGPVPVRLVVLKSFDEATRFLTSLNHWILGVGIVALLLGALLVFLISTTFTRPLANLVAGVHALEQGDFEFPLHEVGHDEVSELTSAFRRMRSTLQETQGKLIESERLATLGQMASTISHDLRHPLTAILANAEFLSADNLTQGQRKDFFQEIRIAVNRMTNELGSLLGFSRQRTDVRPAYGDLRQVIHHSIQTVQAVPEHQAIHIEQHYGERTEGWFDPDKVERVLLNLIFNACEAVDPESGRIEITASSTDQGIIIRVADNGPGIPQEILGQVFDPFVSYGKEKGIGLGLAVVEKIMQDHGGEVSVEQTGSTGTTFLLRFPAQEPAP